MRYGPALAHRRSRSELVGREAFLMHNQLAGWFSTDAKAANATKAVTLDARITIDGSLSAEDAIEYGDLHKKYQQSTFGAHFVEVGVDIATAEIRVRRMLSSRRWPIIMWVDAPPCPPSTPPPARYSTTRATNGAEKTAQRRASREFCRRAGEPGKPRFGDRHRHVGARRGR